VSKRSLTLAYLTAALLIAGCGAAKPRSAAPNAAQVSAQLRGAPAPLATLHAQADQLLGGGAGAFAGRLRSLRGSPVVINKWASWCDPCQSEFPVFQRVSVQFGRGVAFLGLDGKDHAAAAAAFLRRFPVSYPSYQDPDESIARSIQAATYYPQTVYYDRSGKQVYVHAGPYLSASALIHDIRFYVLR
jgi:cytochrome c biogenesis protein CcmG, thiol:disulfide interchange protein DsbE